MVACPIKNAFRCSCLVIVVPLFWLFLVETARRWYVGSIVRHRETSSPRRDRGANDTSVEGGAAVRSSTPSSRNSRSRNSMNFASPRLRGRGISTSTSREICRQPAP